MPDVPGMAAAVRALFELEASQRRDEGCTTPGDVHLRWAGALERAIPRPWVRPVLQLVGAGQSYI